MSKLSFDEIINAEAWSLVQGKLRYLCLYEAITNGIVLDEDYIHTIQVKNNRKTKNQKQDYENTACNFLKNELSNKQRKQARISDDTWN